MLPDLPELGRGNRMNHFTLGYTSQSVKETECQWIDD